MKIILREWRTTDAATLTSLANNKKVSNNLRDQFPYPYSISDAETWITLNKSKTVQNSFVIEADGRFAGGCGVFPKEDVYRCTAEIGYWLGEPFWGKGIASEALKLLLEKIPHIFPNVIRIYAEVFEHNTASAKVLEKNNFYLESTRKNAVIKNGVILSDSVWVKLLRDPS